MAEWHALAKLRMHTDGTLKVLEDLTRELGKLLHQFRDLTCSQFSTVELPRETTARARNNSKKHTSPSEHSRTKTSANARILDQTQAAVTGSGACRFQFSLASWLCQLVVPQQVQRLHISQRL